MYYPVTVSRLNERSKTNAVQTPPWRPSRLFQTVRHFSLVQMFHLVRSRFARPVLGRDPPSIRPRRWTTDWLGPRWRPAARQADGAFRFLGQTARVENPIDWQATQPGRLWRYNLHYLDDLDALEASLSCEARAQLLDQWAAQNPPGQGTGWEPYPLSLRIVNTVKYIRRKNDERTDWLSSLALQAKALEQRVEHHIRANHLFENGKALVFAGTFFEGPTAQTWLQKGLRIIDAECREQFLPDGGHYELSPMYHGTMLWNLCDLICLAEASRVPMLLERTPTWRKLLSRGLDWYAAMTHPDGGIAFFNDAALGIAPDLRTVEHYAELLGVAKASNAKRETPPSLVQLDASGYLRVDLGARSVAIIDVARVGPDYQPGHAHADVLSFELSLNGRRVLVNSGTSTYERGSERDAQRGTAAHNTVIIDDRNSSDTWAGFRVGRRARPRLLEVKHERGQIVVHAMHDGYRRLLNGATHRRVWTWSTREVVIRDYLDGRFGHATAHYYFHPDVEAQIDAHDPCQVNLVLADGRVSSIRVLHGHVALQPSFWHPRFGQSVANSRLRIEFLDNTIETHVSWHDSV